MTFVGQDIDAQRMEIMELQGHHLHTLFSFLHVEAGVSLS